MDPLVFIELQRMRDQEVRYKTNHILHLFMSVITGGLWIVVWICFEIHNSHYRAAARKKIKNLMAQVSDPGISPAGISAEVANKALTLW